MVSYRNIRRDTANESIYGWIEKGTLIVFFGSFRPKLETDKKMDSDNNIRSFTIL